jgi:hypothetical protein
MVDRKEIVVQVVVMLMMDFVMFHDNLMIVDWTMNFVDLDDDDNEHIVLFPLLLDEILNYYNHLVVFFDNNLIKRDVISSNFFFQ